MTNSYVDRLRAALVGAELEFEHLSFTGEPEPDRSAYPMRKTPNLHKPALDLQSFVSPGTVPSAVSHIKAGYAYGMLLNDQLGDCGDAMAIHGDETNYLAAGNTPPPYADEDAEYLYEQVSGYDPNAPLVNGQNPTDTGTDNEKLVAYLQNPGLLCKATGQRSVINASVFVNPSNAQITRIGVWEFTVVYRAYGLPITAQTQKTWRVSDDSLQGDAAVGSWGYHDIVIVAFNKIGPVIVTWGELKQVTWDFDITYGVGGFVTTNKDQENNEGVSPSGLNWTALNQAISQLPSVPAS